MMMNTESAWNLGLKLTSPNGEIGGDFLCSLNYGNKSDPDYPAGCVSRIGFVAFIFARVDALSLHSTAPQWPSA